MIRNSRIFQLIIFGGILLASSELHAQDKKTLDEYLLRWVRSYWTCTNTCPAIRTKIQNLINKGADPNAQSNEYKTALIYAVEKGSANTKENLELVSLLLKSGADPNVKVSNRMYAGRTPLMLASGFNNNRGEVCAAIVKELIQYKADVNTQDDQGFTPLMLLAGSRNPQAVQILLDNGAKVNQTNKDGESALAIATARGDQDAVQILLNHGSDPSLKNKRGISSLDMAMIKKDGLVQDALLKNKKNIGQGSAWTAVEQKNSKILEAMIENGADVNSLRPLREGDTGVGGRDSLLIQAVHNNDIESVKVLLDHKASIDKKGYLNKTAFLKAVEKGYLDIADLLIDKGADMANNFTGNWNALPLAAQKGYIEIVKKMVAKGCPIDSRIGFSSATGLMLAAEAGRIDIVKFLVEHGADINAKSHNFEGNDFAEVFIGNSLDWAKKGGHQEVIAYLNSKGVTP